MTKKTDDVIAEAPAVEAAAPILRPWESWAADAKTPPIQFKAAALMHGWARGQEMTADRFDAAIVASNTHVMR